MTLRSINPATGELLAEFPALDDPGIEAALTLTDSVFRTYRLTTFQQRSAWMAAAGRILDEEKDELGKLLTREMGKPVSAARAEVEKCAWVCRYYAEHAADLLARRKITDGGLDAHVRYQPLGPVLAVMPWNFPFWQVFRFAAPALMAGNTALLKHASNVPQSALAIESVFRRAGFSEGVFQTLLVGSDRVKAIISDPRVMAATLTGSEHAGASLASIAGAHIKKTVLELGGSDPFIIMPSADLDVAAATAVKARMINNGQSCIAAKRFIIHRDVYDRIRDGMVEHVRALKVGDPLDEATDIGPLATASIRDELDAQVKDTTGSGGKCAIGAHTIDAPGNFYQPGILEHVPEASPAARDELFGPVATLFRVDDLEQAIAIANNTRFGLGAAVYTRDTDEQERAAAGIEAGGVFINTMVASDPRLPFGGIKASGYGRELAREGILEFVNVKTVNRG